MRSPARGHGDITQPFVEPCGSLSIRAEPEAHVTELGAGFEVSDQIATETPAARIRLNIEMAKPTNLLIIDVGIGRDAADRHEPIVALHADEKLAWRVQFDAP